MLHLPGARNKSSGVGLDDELVEIWRRKQGNGCNIFVPIFFVLTLIYC